jgi:hypothetical protein
MKKILVSVILIGLAIMFSVVGHHTIQPTELESFTAQVTQLAAFVDPDTRKQTKQDLADMNMDRYRRGMPFFICGGLSGIAGIALITQTMSTALRTKRRSGYSRRARRSR